MLQFGPHMDGSAVAGASGDHHGGAQKTAENEKKAANKPRIKNNYQLVVYVGSGTIAKFKHEKLGPGAKPARYDGQTAARIFDIRRP